LVQDKAQDDGETGLWDLVAQRSRPGTDIQALDQKIWDRFGEKWAVMFTDLAGFSRQVEKFGILHFLQVIHEHKQWLTPVMARHGGLLIKTEADSFIILFRRTEMAVRCAVEMQAAVAEANIARVPETEVLLCIGIGYGEMLRIGEVDVFGREVNAASKLGEDIATAREILLTQAAVDSAGVLEGLSFEPIAARVAGSERNYRLKY
jgi:adenylate cyclase